MKTKFQYTPITEPHLIRTLRNEYLDLLSSLDNVMDYKLSNYTFVNHDDTVHTVSFHYPKDSYFISDDLTERYGSIEDIRLIGKNAIFDTAASYFFNSYIHNFKYFSQYEEGYDVEYFIRIKEGHEEESSELEVLRIILSEEAEPIIHVMNLSFRDLAAEVLLDVR